MAAQEARAAAARATEDAKEAARKLELAVKDAEAKRDEALAFLEKVSLSLSLSLSSRETSFSSSF